MFGFFMMMLILIGAINVVAIVYRKRTKRNLYKDIFNDLRGK